MEFLRRWAPIAVIICLTLVAHRGLIRELPRLPWMRRFPRLLAPARAVLGILSVWIVLGLPLMASHSLSWLPADFTAWAIALSLFWVLTALMLFFWVKLVRPSAFDPGRRRMLALGLPAAVAPLGGAGFGIAVARYGLSVVEQKIVLPGLPRDLDGLRIVQLTDIHFGPFFGAADLRRAVNMANETRAHIAVLTGDLITRAGDDLEGCLDLLKRLRAEAGVYLCHGNHEKYAGLSDAATRLATRQGFTVLRGGRVRLRFGEARLNLAGTDYYGAGTRALPFFAPLADRNSWNVLIQHNPAHFPAAAEAGFDLMLAGHTHGGQVNLPVLRENINVARAFTQYIRGAYELGSSRLYVSCGLGTVGVPVRLGAPPEVSLIRLCAG